MKLLILSCHTGQGHDSASAAIREVWEERGHCCETADALAFVSPWVSRQVARWHVRIYRYLPGLFRWGYAFAEKHPSAFGEKKCARCVLAPGAERLAAFIQEGGYDAVLCSHVFGALLLTETVRRHPFAGHTAFLATDYTCSPGVGASSLDACFIPDACLAEEFCERGVPVRALVPVNGIPVRGSIRQTMDREEAKLLEGISPRHSHVLMMCGSMGCGPMEELAVRLGSELPADVEVTVVCGTNRRLYARLEKKLAGKPNVHLRGFVKDVSRLMDSADLYLTKPGGISTTEAAVKGLPMVLVDAVAGCEEYNLRYFTQCGGAVTADTPEELTALCRELLSDRQMCLAMARALQARSLSGGAENIAEHFLSLDTVRERS